MYFEGATFTAKTNRLLGAPESPRDTLDIVLTRQ